MTHLTGNSKDIFISYLQDFERLRGKAIEYRYNLIKQYCYDEQRDYRVTIFEQIDRILIYHDTNMVFFLRYMLSPQYVSSLFKTIETDSVRIAVDYTARNRQSLIIFVQSVLEAYYIELCSALNFETTQSFSKLTTILFKGIGVNENTNWYKANYILSKIRNTLHNNGIHRHKSETIEYRGTIHQFEQGKPHHSASYECLIMIISDIIEFLSIVGEKSRHIDIISNNGFTDTISKDLLKT